MINCAALHQGRRRRDATRHGLTPSTSTGPANVAHACARAGADLIHVSTDYVFSGDFDGEQRRPYEIDDETGPLSVYGRTKLAGEFAVLAAMPDAHIVRTAWIYSGGDGTDFVATMRRLAAGDGRWTWWPTRSARRPMWATWSVRCSRWPTAIIREPVLHAANAGEASRFEQAQAVFELVGADPARVRPVGSDRHPRPAPRPPYSALSGAQSAAAGLTPLRPWREAPGAPALVHSAAPLPSTP